MTSSILSAGEVSDITMSVLKTVLPKSRVARVEVNRDGLTFPAELGIAVIFNGRGSVHLTGKQLVEIDKGIMAELWKNGDERFPHIRYLTSEEAKDLVS
ncbi:MAG TPA: hypothetical protein VGB91_09875 [Rhizomicrobium sp.]